LKSFSASGRTTIHLLVILNFNLKKHEEAFVSLQDSRFLTGQLAVFGKFAFVVYRNMHEYSVGVLCS
jgi:hypothetical protein